MRNKKSMKKYVKWAESVGYRDPEHNEIAYTHYQNVRAMKKKSEN